VKNYHEYLKSDELDWYWSVDRKARTHKLTLTHIPTKKSVNGTITEGKGRDSLTARKRELQETLTEQLEDLVFGK
jgi:hypothetical protein